MNGTEKEASSSSVGLEALDTCCYTFTLMTSEFLMVATKLGLPGRVSHVKNIFFLQSFFFILYLFYFLNSVSEQHKAFRSVKLH